MSVILLKIRDKEENAHVVKVTKRVHVQYVHIRWREQHVRDERREHVPRIECEEAGEEVHPVRRDKAEDHDVVCAAANTLSLKGGHHGAEEHMAHEQGEEDRESFVFPS